MLFKERLKMVIILGGSLLRPLGCVLATNMKLDVVVSKWWTARLHVGSRFFLATNLFLSTENVSEAAFQTYHSAGLSILDGFQFILDVVIWDVG